tara:strand:+ start:752 stop:877 length:126 start_codon:yes stop_codon:yes gene_type:complete
MTVFNEVHNPHLLNTSIGTVAIQTTNDQKKTHKQKSKVRDR